jgi:hypothetical protein
VGYGPPGPIGNTLAAAGSENDGHRPRSSSVSPNPNNNQVLYIFNAHDIAVLMLMQGTSDAMAARWEILPLREISRLMLSPLSPPSVCFMPPRCIHPLPLPFIYMHLSTFVTPPTPFAAPQLAVILCPPSVFACSIYTTCRAQHPTNVHVTRPAAASLCPFPAFPTRVISQQHRWLVITTSTSSRQHNSDPPAVVLTALPRHGAPCARRAAGAAVRVDLVRFHRP